MPPRIPLLFAIWATSTAIHVAAAQCANWTAPLELPLRLTQSDPAVPDSLVYGIPMMVGTPPQRMLVLPWAELNNTYLYDRQSDGCDPTIIWNDEICKIRTGGYFSEKNSTSFTKCADLISCGGSPKEISCRGMEPDTISGLVSTSFAGNDRLITPGGATVDIPIGVPRIPWDRNPSSYTIMHPLGLGANSTLLNRLVEVGQIPSRVWSIFWGRMWTDVAVNGSVVLGGYDSHKATGDNFTKTLDFNPYTGCWTGMKVAVSELLVNFRNGTDVNVLESGTSLNLCIVPQRALLLEMASSIIGTLEALMGIDEIGPSYGIHWGARLISDGGNSIFDGDLTFVLDSGLEIRVPNSQFITPQVDILRNGSLSVNETQKELLMALLSADKTPTLGRYFLTSAYLMVNHDANKFTLWQANPTDQSDLVPVLSQPPGNNCEGSEGDSGPSHPARKEVIVGGVVGGSLALAALVAFAFFLRRRYPRQQKQSQAADSPATEPIHTVSIIAEADPAPGYSEIEANYPKEVPGPETLVELPAPVEVHGDSAGHSQTGEVYGVYDSPVLSTSLQPDISEGMGDRERKTLRGQGVNTEVE